MIYLTSGLPGSGKTLYTIAQVKKRAEDENRPVFYLGIGGLVLPGWTQIADFVSWLKCPQGSLIVIDECQEHLPPQARGKGVAVPPEVQGFSTHRHRGVDVYLITQDAMQFDHFVRRLVGVHVHLVRPFGMQYAQVWQFESVIPFQAEKAAAGFYDKISQRSRFDYPTDLFNVYKSAEVHTHKRRLPWKKLALVGALLVGISVAAVVAYRTVRHGIGSGSEVAKDESKGKGAAEGGFLPGGGRAAPATTAEYVRARIPRVQGVPESAPVYDALAVPVTFPRVSACAIYRGVCKCWTQQGSVVPDVLPEVCIQFVREGSFDPYRGGGNGAASAAQGSGGTGVASTMLQGQGGSSKPVSGNAVSASLQTAIAPSGASSQGGGVVANKSR